MQCPMIIENIEEMRRKQGIDDVELRQEIRGLKSGDFVRLTFLAQNGDSPGETLAVRITRIQGYSFRGKLASAPAVAELLPNLRVGAPVVFTTAHIHSLQKGESDEEDRL